MVTKKECLILDLDETLIHSISKEEMKGMNKKDKQALLKFKTHNMDDYYTVVERPGLQQFLDYIFKKFNVSIWTAASKDYALFVIENIIAIKPDRKIDWIMFSYHCDMSKKEKKGSKDLNMLWDTLKLNKCSKDNTVILDDHPDVYKLQKENCINIPPFDTDGSIFNNDIILFYLVEQFKKYNGAITKHVKTINEKL